MPCAYYAPMVMTIHSEMAAHHVQDIAGEVPYILAGDWNLTPDSATYKLLTTGALPKEDASFPTPKHDFNWMPMIQPMKSAYAEFEGSEPDFTSRRMTRSLIRWTIFFCPRGGRLLEFKRFRIARM